MTSIVQHRPQAPTSGGVATRLEAALRPFLGGDLPVRLIVWDGSAAGPALAATQARIRGRLPSKDRDRSAISHHCDTTADFYSLVLDEDTRAYSCGYHASPDQPLAEAVARRRGLTDLVEFRLCDYRDAVPFRGTEALYDAVRPGGAHGLPWTRSW